MLLASGEGGNHIALLSYYALLNAGVFALAFMRSWHPLNLLGFVFTFMIGAAWGGLSIWFNLILLRSAAHYVGIDYRIDALVDSQFVQAMLSLVWSASALVLMRASACLMMRRAWWGGAFALGIVVLKLFLVDLANGGSIARVVSFVGVGLLLLLVGYLAPYPKTAHGAPSAASA